MPAQAEAVGTAGDAVAAAVAALAAAGCESPRLDAELLIANAVGVDRAALIADPALPVPPPAARLAMERVRRRVMREPVAYILGRKGFRRIDLAVDARVLIPRPETELLVEVARELAPQGGAVHDVGTGSGAIALALRDERPDLAVSASDASAGAIDVARANAERLALPVDLSVGRDVPASAATVDLVVANLPYVREDEWSGLQPEIARYEPRDALVGGGPDGLDSIRALVASLPGGTAVALEHAPDQAEAVMALLDEPRTHRDLSERPRVTAGGAR